MRLLLLGALLLLETVCHAASPLPRPQPRILDLHQYYLTSWWDYFSPVQPQQPPPGPAAKTEQQPNWLQRLDKVSMAVHCAAFLSTAVLQIRKMWVAVKAMASLLETPPPVCRYLAHSITMAISVNSGILGN